MSATDKPAWPHERAAIERWSTSSAPVRTSSRWRRWSARCAPARPARHISSTPASTTTPRCPGIFFEELGLPKPDHLLGVGSGSHGAQTARALERLEAVLDELRPRPSSSPATSTPRSRPRSPRPSSASRSPTWKRVCGASTATMPEEINRVLVDQLAQLVLHSQPRGGGAPEPRRRSATDRVHFVGNTMIDTLVRLRPRISDSDVHRRAGDRAPPLPARDTAPSGAGRRSAARPGDRAARRRSLVSCQWCSRFTRARARDLNAECIVAPGIRFVDRWDTSTSWPSRRSPAASLPIPAGCRRRRRSSAFLASHSARTPSGRSR